MAPMHCPFCDAETTTLKALVAEMETRAPAPSREAPANARQHTTAVLMDLLIERLLEELNHPMHVVRVLVGRVLGVAGIDVIAAALVPGTPDGVEVLPTTEDVRDLSETELAEMKGLPTA